MADNRITFDQLPDVVQNLSNKIDNIETLLMSILESNGNSDKNKWFTIEGIANYLPNKPAVSTLRDKARRREIPCVKQGKRWLFNKAIIDKWMQSNSHKTVTQLSVEAESYVSSRNTKKNIKYFRIKEKN